MSDMLCQLLRQQEITEVLTQHYHRLDNMNKKISLWFCIKRKYHILRQNLLTKVCKVRKPILFIRTDKKHHTVNQILLICASSTVSPSPIHHEF
jgi:hypothetical protein